MPRILEVFFGHVVAIILTVDLPWPNFVVTLERVHLVIAFRNERPRSDSSVPAAHRPKLVTQFDISPVYI